MNKLYVPVVILSGAVSAFACNQTSARTFCSRMHAQSAREPQHSSFVSSQIESDGRTISVPEIINFLQKILWQNKCSKKCCLTLDFEGRSNESSADVLSPPTSTTVGPRSPCSSDDPEQLFTWFAEAAAAAAAAPLGITGEAAGCWVKVNKGDGGWKWCWVTLLFLLTVIAMALTLFGDEEAADWPSGGVWDSCCCCWRLRKELTELRWPGNEATEFERELVLSKFKSSS